MPKMKPSRWQMLAQAAMLQALASIGMYTPASRSPSEARENNSVGYNQVNRIYGLGEGRNHFCFGLSINEECRNYGMG